MALYPEHKLFVDEFKHRFNMIDKVCGTDKIREMFGKQYRWEEVAKQLKQIYDNLLVNNV